jgi:hypothetical protein
MMCSTVKRFEVLAKRHDASKGAHKSGFEDRIVCNAFDDTLLSYASAL